jgi:hypothetical protein
MSDATTSSTILDFLENDVHAPSSDDLRHGRVQSRPVASGVRRSGDLVWGSKHEQDLGAVLNFIVEKASRGQACKCCHMTSLKLAGPILTRTNNRTIFYSRGFIKCVYTCLYIRS